MQGSGRRWRTACSGEALPALVDGQDAMWLRSLSAFPRAVSGDRGLCPCAWPLCSDIGQQAPCSMCPVVSPLRTSGAIRPEAGPAGLQPWLVGADHPVVQLNRARSAPDANLHGSYLTCRSALHDRKTSRVFDLARWLLERKTLPHCTTRAQRVHVHVHVNVLPAAAALFHL